MNKQKWWMAVMALALMGGAVTLLTYLRAHQTLGKPGVKTSPLPGESFRVQVALPEAVPGFDSELLEMEKLVVDLLPADTSYGKRLYTAPDGFQLLVNAVLMGTDRTSLHKPQICLGGAGWRIDEAASSVEKVRIERPQPYDLPVMRLVTHGEVTRNGERVPATGMFVYWFVADGEYTANHNQRMWWMARDLVLSGILQRWTYISCFSVCAPGEEQATFGRMKQFIAAAVPEFQLTPKPEPVAVSARR